MGRRNSRILRLILVDSESRKQMKIMISLPMGCIAMAICFIVLIPGRDGLFSQKGLFSQTQKTIEALRIMQMTDEWGKGIGETWCEDIFDCTKDANVTYFPIVDPNNGNYLGPSDWKFGNIYTLDATLYGWAGCNFLVPVCKGLAKGTNKNCILQSSICDGSKDCEDGSDENAESCHSMKVSMIFDKLSEILYQYTNNNWINAMTDANVEEMEAEELEDETAYRMA